MCGKHLSALKDSPNDSEEYGAETTFSFDISNIPTLKDVPQKVSPLSEIRVAPPKPRSRSKFRSNVVDKDIAAYKRVIWQDLSEYVFYLEGSSCYVR